MRSVFFVSDRTAITAETLGHSLLAQFEGTAAYREATIPYVDTPEKAQAVVARIEKATRADGAQALVFSTLADPATRNLLVTCNALVLDLFDVFLEPLQKQLKVPPIVKRAQSHRISNLSLYESRIGAIDYSLQHDDGSRVKDYDKSEILLLGVSRSGKTPTCLYLAMHFGIRAANYPITEEDLGRSRLPEPVLPFMDRVYGLTIDAKRLASIREERRPNSRYASLDQCRREVRKVEGLYRTHKVPYFNTTNMSVEEIATRVVQTLGLERHSI
jgi:regulator of PEP synthase PpsR (kinase-PPPase family)